MTNEKEISVKNFHCSEHGYIKPTPACPKCKSTIHSAEAFSVGYTKGEEFGRHSEREALREAVGKMEVRFAVDDNGRVKNTTPLLDGRKVLALLDKE